MSGVLVVSPPFRSHAQPLSVLATALSQAGARVGFACAPGFADLVAGTGVEFHPLSMGDNANSGVAERTAQAESGRARLAEFLDATRQGALPALLTQTLHRRADMLREPEQVLADIRELHDRIRPDWYLVDQLSYAVTLALYCLGARFATFCPGHPTYLITRADQLFGVPQCWPSTITPDPDGLTRLREAASATDRQFTETFAEFVRAHSDREPPARAFALCSPEAVVLNYPPLPWLPPLPDGPERIFLGHCTNPTEPLPDDWAATLARVTDDGRRALVLIALGTFLSARDDVLRVVATGALALGDDVAVVLATGDRERSLADLAGARLVTAPVVPQQSLLRHTAAMVHHGGNNSNTECLDAGVPALILPFSSDQFAIAHDGERSGAARALDPTTLTPELVAEALRALLAGPRPDRPGPGPRAGAEALLDVFGRGGDSRDTGEPARPA